MMPVDHPNMTRRIGAPKNWDPARDGECGALEVADVMDAEHHQVMESLWRPDPVELAALNAGGAVILHVYGRVHPVVSMAVTAGAVSHD